MCQRKKKTTTIRDMKGEKQFEELRECEGGASAEKRTDVVFSLVRVYAWEGCRGGGTYHTTKKEPRENEERNRKTAEIECTPDHQDLNKNR